MAAAVMRRGDFAVAAIAGDYGKPRPVLVIQSDLFAQMPSVTVCPLTGEWRDDAGLMRLAVEPVAATGLRQKSQIAIDKIVTLPRGKISRVIGHADDELMMRVNRALALFIGIV